jgi:hypothetical protein
MKTSHLLYLSRYVTAAEGILEEAGVSLEFGDDLSDFKVLCETTDGRHPLGLSFDPDFTSVRNGMALWVAGRDQSGRIVCTMSVKLLKLKKASLLDHLNSKFLTYRPREQRFLTNEPSIQLSERAAVLRGKACYCGELWLAKSHRGGHMTAILPRLVYALALLRWSPDFFFWFHGAIGSLQRVGSPRGFYESRPRRNFLAHQ